MRDVVDHHELGGALRQDGHLPVLVDPVPLNHFHFPLFLNSLEKSAPLVCQLEGEEEVVVLVEVEASLPVLPGQHPGRQNLPRGALAHVAHPQDVAGVVALGWEGVAGNDIRVEELDPCLLLDDSDAHLMVVLEPDGIVGLDVDVLQHVDRPAMVRRGQNDVAFHSSLTTFIQLFLKGFIFGLDCINFRLVGLAVSQFL